MSSTKCADMDCPNCEPSCSTCGFVGRRELRWVCDSCGTVGPCSEADPPFYLLEAGVGPGGDFDACSERCFVTLLHAYSPEPTNSST